MLSRSYSWQRVDKNKSLDELRLTATSKSSRMGLVVRDTETFRALASTVVGPKDYIVDIGSSYGVCTAVLAAAVRSPSHVVGVETSREVKAAASKRYPLLHFVRLDVLRAPDGLKQIVQNLLSKNNEDSKTGVGGHRLVVFLDIGGNRELESVSALTLWLMGDGNLTMKPRLIVVKSETLFDSGNDLTEKGWKKLSEQAAAAVIARRSTVERKQPGSARKTRENGDLYSIAKRTKLPPHSLDIPRSARRLHPLKMPERKTSEGVSICRFHNYDKKRGCLKHRDVKKQNTICPYDHNYCHNCLKSGHIALDCPKPPLQLL